MQLALTVSTLQGLLESRIVASRALRLGKPANLVPNFMALNHDTAFRSVQIVENGTITDMDAAEALLMGKGEDRLHTAVCEVHVCYTTTAAQGWIANLMNKGFLAGRQVLLCRIMLLNCSGASTKDFAFA